MKQETYLVGDIGGTNVRFALSGSESAELRSIKAYKCAEYATVEDALGKYLKDTATSMPDAFCLAAAGPVVSHEINVTNNHWTINAASLHEHFNVARVELVNDFEAVAWCIPELQNRDRMSIGDVDAQALSGRPFRVAVVGPGTGFGVAGLISDGRTLMPVVGEGGHMGFAPASALQIRVLEILRRRFGFVSLERLVSGTGLRNIYAALGEIDGQEKSAKSASQVFADGAAGDPIAVVATQMFFELLGQFAGDFALAFGAIDGVYIGGGIARRYPEMLNDGRFRSAFENKGKFDELMGSIPTSLILHNEPGLLGAAAYLKRQG